MAKTGEVCGCDESNEFRAQLLIVARWLAETHASREFDADVDEGAREVLAGVQRVLRKYRRPQHIPRTRRST